MSWTVTFFSRKVEDQTLKLPPGVLAKLLRILELIEEFGPELGEPHTKALGDGLFEIRARGKEGIGRSLFCVLAGQEIVILHTFVKKSRKTPPQALNLARNRVRLLTTR